jgi:hypothetical protein
MNVRMTQYGNFLREGFYIQNFLLFVDKRVIRSKAIIQLRTWKAINRLWIIKFDQCDFSHSLYILWNIAVYFNRVAVTAKNIFNLIYLFHIAFEINSYNITFSINMHI